MREQVRIVLGALHRRGLHPRLVPGGKHQRIVVEANGRVVSIPIASSPRDRHECGLNTLKQIERRIGVAGRGAGRA